MPPELCAETRLQANEDQKVDCHSVVAVGRMYSAALGSVVAVVWCLPLTAASAVALSAFM